MVAYPCFRFKITGHYFALVTLALSGIVLQVITATRDHTGGSLGYTPERYQGGSSLYALQFTSKTTWYLIALGVWAVGLWIWYRVDQCSGDLVLGWLPGLLSVGRVRPSV